MTRAVINKFNRGVIDDDALARDDVKKVNNSASEMVNFLPQRLGPMVYRPGFEYLFGMTVVDHRLTPFIKSVTDTAFIDFQSGGIEFIVNDQPAKTTVNTTSILNGTFSPSNVNWTDASTGSSSTSNTGSGQASLLGDGTGKAVLYQTLTGTTDLNTEQTFDIRISEAPVVVKIGISGAGSSEVFSGTLRVGWHFLTFTPTSDITITLENSEKYRALVEYVQPIIISKNLRFVFLDMTSARLKTLRTRQSGDIMYSTWYDEDDKSTYQFQIEHRGDKSWSFVDYVANDGPFRTINITNVTLSPGALSGNTTLTASDDVFSAQHAFRPGALFKVGSNGQTVISTVAVDTGAGTNSIRVFGVGSARNYTRIITGIATAIVTTQRSADDGATWEDVGTFTSDTNSSFNDSLDNAILLYRLYIKAGDNPGLDTVIMQLVYAAGSIEGICRVTQYTSPTAVNIQVLEDFGDTNASKDWYEGEWSADRGFPASVEIAEGRVWFGGKDKLWGSVSDAYYSFDRTIEGDSASIFRTIGFGYTDPIKWLKDSNKIVFGTTGGENSIRSSSFGEVLTNTNANIKKGSSQGVDSNNEPIEIDNTVFFVQRSRTKIYSLDNYLDQDKFDTIDLNTLNQNITKPMIKKMAVVRQPETRIFALLEDGDLAVYTVDRSEDSAGWSLIDIRDDDNTTIVDIAVLPGEIEDRLYLITNRNTGAPSYYLEKMALFCDCEAGSSNKTLDAHVVFTSPGTTITGLSHLEGKTVGVWGDSQDRGDFLVSSGQITVPSAWTDVVVGMRYIADYESSKIVGYDDKTVLTEKKRVVDVGVILSNYWPQSLTIGPDKNSLENLPLIQDGVRIDLTQTMGSVELTYEFNGETENDPRIHMRATGPVKVKALTYDVEQSSNQADQEK